jgi:D-alanine-D-alanine ligase
MKQSDDPWGVIRDAVERTQEIAHDIEILLVLNELTGAGGDYVRHSVRNEYLNEIETSEISTSLRRAGFAISTYDGERAFIGEMLSGYQSQRHRKYVFCTTGSGVGRARTSLIPAFCHLHGIPLCSADGYTAALLEHKFHCFRLLDALGFHTPRTWFFSPTAGWVGGVPPKGLCVICKPNFECSSIGIDADSVFDFSDEKMEKIRSLCMEFRQGILVQEFIPGFEVEVPVFPSPHPVSPVAAGIEVSGRKELGDSFLTYDIVGNSKYSFYDYEDENSAIARELRLTAQEVYRKLGFSGLVRIDFRVTPLGRWCITDVNTPPHITHNSSYAFAFECAGMTHADLMTMLATVGRFNDIRSDR